MRPKRAAAATAVSAWAGTRCAGLPRMKFGQREWTQREPWHEKVMGAEAGPGQKEKAAGMPRP